MNESTNEKQSRTSSINSGSILRRLGKLKQYEEKKKKTLTLLFSNQSFLWKKFYLLNITFSKPLACLVPNYLSSEILQS